MLKTPYFCLSNDKKASKKKTSKKKTSKKKTSKKKTCKKITSLMSRAVTSIKMLTFKLFLIKMAHILWIQIPRPKYVHPNITMNLCPPSNRCHLKPRVS